MPDFSFPALKDSYTPLLNTFKVRPEKEKEVQQTTNKLAALLPKYTAITKATGVPEEVIALIHMRESNNNFDTYLGNGQSLYRKTTIVPKGRGPFKNFFDGAVDALKHENLHLVKDWSDERVCHVFESYNGFGYRYSYSNIPSPYLWGGTTVQKPGKFIADGKYRASVLDTQLGCIPVYMRLKSLKKPVQPILTTPSTPQPPLTEKPWYVSLTEFITTLFKR